MSRFVLFLVGFLYVAVSVKASDNGGYYECNTALLNDGICEFQGTATAPTEWTSPVGPHDIDLTVGATNQRCLFDISSVKPDECLNVTPKPWAQDVVLASVTSSTTPSATITGLAWNYVLAFEMMAPFRDMFMYEAGGLRTMVESTNANYVDTNFEDMVQIYRDCKIKEVDVMHGNIAVKGTDSILQFMYPITQDTHNFILQYIEEGSIDLVCLMTDLEMGDGRCANIRAINGIKLGEYSDCWIPYYEAKYSTTHTSDTTNRGSRWDVRLHELEVVGGFSMTSNEAGNVDCIAIVHDSTSEAWPTAAQISAGTDYNDVAAAATFQGTASAGSLFEFNFSGLTEGTDYDAYCALDGVRTEAVAFIPSSTANTGGCATGECDMDDIWTRAEAAGIDLSDFPHLQ